MDAEVAADERERGESLLELIIAVAIMGIAVVAIVSGLATSIIVSDVHRKQATAGEYVRSFAESIETAVAGSPTGYSATCSPSYGSGFSVPSGFNAQVATVTYWTGSAFSATCPATDSGMQKVSLKVSSTDGRASEKLDVIIRKPCRLLPDLPC
jgi:type II secretory pathway pseudopilin PulG